MASLSASNLPGYVFEHQLDVWHGYAVIVSSAIVCHLIFKRWEPLFVPVVTLLLVVAPLCLSIVLVPHFGAVVAVPLTFGIYLTTLVASIFAYRLSPFHAYYRYPGPILLRLSNICYAVMVISGKQYKWHVQLFEKYGDVVRIGPNHIMVRDASLIPKVLGPDGLTKGQNWTGRTLHPPVIPLIGERDPKKHAQRRKPWARAFGIAGLKEFQVILAHRVHQLIEGLEARQGQPVDMQEWFGFFSYDFMGDMAFGGWTDMLKDGADVHGFWKLVKSGVKPSIVFETIPWLAYYLKHFPGIATRAKSMRAMGRRAAERRYAAGSTTKDLFYYLSNEDGAEKVSPSRAEVISNGSLAVVAGSDTTSTALSNTLWFLLQNPEIYGRLQAEIDKFYPPGENALETTHHSKMVYLEAVLKESLRMLPPAPGGSHRSPEIGKGGKLVGSLYIPEGHVIRLPIYALHHDPRNFSYPETFWPERWLIADGVLESKETIVHNAAAHIPFGYGPANCVGRTLAMGEMRTVLCHLLQNLTFRFVDGYDPAVYLEQYLDRGVVTGGPVPVVVEKRKH